MHRRPNHLTRNAFWLTAGVPFLATGRARALVTTIALILAVSGFGPHSAIAAIPAFDSEIVDPGDGDTGLYASLQRDSAGNLHVAYYDTDLEALRY
ncbi:MAG: hypothetical protein KDA27_27440, partial [Candidatus Eisenbacteria bacterium]|nr:hypothetical protein [Candidatus Eisenbacteria bacterium]